jgi:hypothetical protein
MKELVKAAAAAKDNREYLLSRRRYRHCGHSDDRAGSTASCNNVFAWMTTYLGAHLLPQLDITA